RSPRYLSRKVVKGAVDIKKGSEKKLVVGDLSARMDWGYAGDYVEAMRLMLASDSPGEYIVGTGEAHSVREMAEIAFDELGLDWKAWVSEDRSLLRGEVKNLCGDYAKLKSKTGWVPRHSFRDWITQMVRQEVEEYGYPKSAS